MVPVRIARRMLGEPQLYTCCAESSLGSSTAEARSQMEASERLQDICVINTNCLRSLFARVVARAHVALLHRTHVLRALLPVLGRRRYSLPPSSVGIVSVGSTLDYERMKRGSSCWMPCVICTVYPKHLRLTEA
jgi:hypothetical protein